MRHFRYMMMVLRSYLPSGVLGKFEAFRVVEADDVCTERLQVLAFGEDTRLGSGTEVRAVDISIYCHNVFELGCRSTANIGAEDNVGMLGGIEQVELVPANEIPVAVIAVEHKFATTKTTDFPDKAAYVHIVSRVTH